MLRRMDSRCVVALSCCPFNVSWASVSALKKSKQCAWHLIPMLLKCRPPGAALMWYAAATTTFNMTKNLICFVTVAFICGSMTIFAQGGAKPANVGEGTVMVKGKNYPLKNAAAYETT